MSARHGRILEFRTAWRSRAGIVLTLSLFACAQEASAQCQYEIEAIIEPPVCPPFFDPTLLYVTGLNNDGVVCGYYEHCVNSNLDVPFIWTAEDGIDTLLPLPPGFNSGRANDVNDEGIVGGVISGLGIEHGFIWDDGEWTLIEPLPGGAWCEIFAINNAGTAVGFRSIGPGTHPYTAFVYKDGVITDLGTMIEPASIARDVNDQDVVVGYAGLQVNPIQQGFVWQEGALTMLNDVPGTASSDIVAINNHNVFIGNGSIQTRTGLVFRGAMWQADEPMLLPLLPGFASSNVNGIRDYLKTRIR